MGGSAREKEGGQEDVCCNTGQVSNGTISQAASFHGRADGQKGLMFSFFKIPPSFLRGDHVCFAVSGFFCRGFVKRGQRIDFRVDRFHSLAASSPSSAAAANIIPSSSSSFSSPPEKTHLSREEEREIGVHLITHTHTLEQPLSAEKASFLHYTGCWDSPAKFPRIYHGRRRRSYSVRTCVPCRVCSGSNLSSE